MVTILWRNANPLLRPRTPTLVALSPSEVVACHHLTPIPSIIPIDS